MRLIQLEFGIRNETKIYPRVVRSQRPKTIYRVVCTMYVLVPDSRTRTIIWLRNQLIPELRTSTQIYHILAYFLRSDW